MSGISNSESSLAGNPDGAQEALNFLNGALGTLRMFTTPHLISQGWFKITVRDQQQAVVLAQSIEEQIEMACAVPDVNLWFRRERWDDIPGEPTISLEEYFLQGRKGRRLFKKLMEARLREITDLCRVCTEVIEHDRRRQLRISHCEILKELLSNMN
ncbi:MAG: hypothetical protein JST44_15935 [Cyanobacteria bacterium SZAS LIN-5]|nr:hypothetical protein [Cyanobacteria bacterium SZAS LIN-5]